MSIVLTTYPEARSRNVGDHLITASCVDLMRCFGVRGDIDVMFRECSLDDITQLENKRIYAPGFSVANNAYPEVFSLASDLTRIENFYPLGCSLQWPGFAGQEAGDYLYAVSSLRLLHYVANRFGAFACRDQFIVDVLHQHGIPALLFGDLALYDTRIVGREFVDPRSIRRLAVTVPHAAKYFPQLKEILLTLRFVFPHIDIVLTQHSRPSSVQAEVMAWAESEGFAVQELHGESTSLTFYDDFDAHIGYRLHGHIYFLRRRKPSVLMLEDVRSFGFSQTGDFSHGCFSAFEPGTARPRQSSVMSALQFFEASFNSGFSGYEKIFSQIDALFRDVVAPFFRRIVS